MLQEDGGTCVRHAAAVIALFKHSHKTGRITVPGKLSERPAFAPGTLNSILEQADLKK